jgi:hypothetical protein
LRYFRVGLRANKSSHSPSSVYGSVVPNVKTSTVARNADLTELVMNMIQTTCSIRSIIVVYLFRQQMMRTLHCFRNLSRVPPASPSICIISGFSGPLFLNS